MPRSKFRVTPSRSTRTALLGLLGSCALVGIGMSFGSGAAPGVRVVGVVFATLSGIGLRQALRLSVEATTEGVIVRGWRSTSVHFWGDIASIDVLPGKTMLPTNVLAIRNLDCSVVVAGGVAASTLFRKHTFVDQAAARLNEHLRHFRESNSC